MLRCKRPRNWDAAREPILIDVRKLRQSLPTGRKAWWIAIVALSLVAGAVALLDRGSATAAITYVLF